MTNRTDSKDVYEIVRERILAALESGTVPWQRPWSIKTPMNAVSKHRYSGINLFLLPRDYTDQRYLTFNQAKQLGGSVRKGEKGHLVVFWKMVPTTKEDENGKEVKKMVPLLRYYTVFNVAQCDGLKLKAAEVSQCETPPMEEAESIVANMKNRPTIRQEGDRACYSPMLDTIMIPQRANFVSDEAFYSTLFHEMTHSTGHSSRLDRFTEEEQGFVFASESYSKEELTAEFGASFLCAAAGIDNESTWANSAAYIKSWHSAIKNADKRMLISAASKAQRAAEFILDTSVDEEQAEEPALATA